MDVAETLEAMYTDRGKLALPDARIGLIIPSSNRNTEPQFHHYTPDNIGVHIQRIQMTGRHEKPLNALLPEIYAAAQTLGDAKPNVIVFHCTGTAMRAGPEGENRIIQTIEEASGIKAITTAGAVCEALRALKVQDLVLVTPYLQKVNEEEKHYLRLAGFNVIHDFGLQLATSDETLAVRPDRWMEVVRNNLRNYADGYFLSCTNTSQIEVIDLLEAELKKPLVSSNQAVIWACISSISKQGIRFSRPRNLGKLMSLEVTP
ncbi:MAG: hypothetical protein Q8M03_09195 [Legionella sp.]|nr:hypothetical protein [Legionella sp.]